MIGRLLLATLVALPLSGASSSPAPRTHVVRIDQMKFGPMPTDARIGDAIMWVNADLVPHTASAGNGSFDVNLPAGKKAATRLRTAGAFAVLCKFHPGMKATLQVGKRDER